MEKSLTRNGVTLFYEVLGSGPTLLLSHGFGASAAMWAPQREALSANHRLILWDMRGHARSDSPEDPAALGQSSPGRPGAIPKPVRSRFLLHRGHPPPGTGQCRLAPPGGR